MEKRSRRALNLLLAAVFVLGIVMTGRQALDNNGSGEDYEAAVQIASSEAPSVPTTIPTTAPTEPQTLPPEPVYEWIPAPVEEEDPILEELKEIDLSALREVNPDVIGWILVPETKVNYPIMQGEDNDYYLNHTWNGRRSSAGSIFLEVQNDPALTDFNTILYGHNMQSGAMFAELRKYRYQAFYDERPYVYLVNDEGIFRYEIFAAYRAELESSAYGLSFNQTATREEFIDEALEKNTIEIGVTPEVNDRMLTLVTCSAAGYSNRWVVQARLKMIRVEVPQETA